VKNLKKGGGKKTTPNKGAREKNNMVPVTTGQALENDQSAPGNRETPFVMPYSDFHPGTGKTEQNVDPSRRDQPGKNDKNPALSTQKNCS